MACLCQQSGGGGGQPVLINLGESRPVFAQLHRPPFPASDSAPSPEAYSRSAALAWATGRRPRDKHPGRGGPSACSPAALRRSSSSPTRALCLPGGLPCAGTRPAAGAVGPDSPPRGATAQVAARTLPPPPITDWHLPARGGRAAPASSSPPPKQRLQRRRRPLPASPGLASAPAAAQALQSPAAAALLASLPDDAAAASPVPVSPSRLAASHHSPERRAHPRRSPSGASSWFGLSATPAAGSYHLAHRGGKEAAGENAPGAGGGSGVSRGALSLGFVAGWP